MSPPNSLTHNDRPTHAQLARSILDTANPNQKAEYAKAIPERGFVVALDDAIPPPTRPARAERPPLASPADVPRRRLTTRTGRVALLHAIAHIELNAINLAADMALRFSNEISELGLNPHEFCEDWLCVVREEGQHFLLLSDRLAALDAAYGDLPAHDGLWQVAENTSDSVLARLAIAPLVLEARGLDVTPGMIAKLTAAGDHPSADILKIIYAEEVDHVRKGAKWFERVCNVKKFAPAETFRALVETRFAGALKPPFNIDARTRANIPAPFYE